MAYAPASSRTPPPLPGTPAPFIGDTSQNVSRLTADLDAILARRPVAAPVISSSLPARDATQDLNTNSDATSQSLDQSDESDAGYVWLDRTGRPISVDKNPNLERPAGWLRRARRERVVLRAKSVAAWTLALVSALSIAGLSAFVMLGRLPSLGDVWMLGQQILR